MAEPEAEPGQWLSHAEAALRLGWKQGRVIAARRQGRLQGRKGNDGAWRVFVPDAMVESEPGLGSAEADLAAELREDLAEARERASRAEGELVAELRRSHDLAAGLAKAEARADRLEAALQEARRPVLLRLLEALRRR